MQGSKPCALPLGYSPTWAVAPTITGYCLVTVTVTIRSKELGWLEGLEPSTSRATIWRASQLRHSHHKKNTPYMEPYKKVLRLSVPKGIRTPDPRLRRPLLYPAELWTHIPLGITLCCKLFLYKQKSG